MSLDTVCVYLKSFLMIAGKHSESVWQVAWVVRGTGAALEKLVSISTDGRVEEWAMKKGLQPTGMTLPANCPLQLV